MVIFIETRKVTVGADDGINIVILTGLEEGELVVSGNVFLGYIGDPKSWGRESVHTGDMGTIDTDGHITIAGRKKNLLITSFGRNVNPEWPEAELLGGGLLRQAVVFGEAKPYCVALLFPAMPGTEEQEIRSWVKEVNEGLPDYARVMDFICLDAAMSAQDGLYTDNGRPKRDAIACRYDDLIASLYERVAEPPVVESHL